MVNVPILLVHLSALVLVVSMELVSFATITTNAFLKRTHAMTMHPATTQSEPLVASAMTDFPEMVSIAPMSMSV